RRHLLPLPLPLLLLLPQPRLRQRQLPRQQQQRLPLRGPLRHRDRTRRRNLAQLLRRAVSPSSPASGREAKVFQKCFLLLSRARERNYHLISARLHPNQENPHYVKDNPYLLRVAVSSVFRKQLGELRSTTKGTRFRRIHWDASENDCRKRQRDTQRGSER